MKWRFACVLAFTCLSNATAAVEVADVRPPDSGPWKGQTPGSFVVFKSNAWDGGPSAVFRRELLLGVDARGYPILQSANSDSPDGPWDKPTLQTRPFDPKPNRTLPAVEKTFVVGDKPIRCRGTHEEWTADGNAVVTETLTDLTIGRKVYSRKVTTAAGAAFGTGEVIEDRLETVETRRVGEQDVTVSVYRSTTTRDGKPYMSRRYGVADDVPGGRVLYQRWVGGGEPPARLPMDELVVSIGFDADTVTFLTGKTPTTVPASR